VANKHKILLVLSNVELCDDCLSVASNIKPRQTVHGVCKDLFAKGLIHRVRGKCDHCHKAKLTNRVSVEDQFITETTTPAQTPAIEKKGGSAWYWEGNVQARVVSYLAYNGYTVQRVANTASREAGKDIIAVASDGSELWVSVKGYPERSSSTQARHWFSGAVFDLLLYRGQDPNVKLALAFPTGFVTYSNLLLRIAWLQEMIPFKVFWVSEDGSVRVE